MEMEEGGAEEKGLPGAATTDRLFHFPEPERSASAQGDALGSVETCKRKPWYHIADG